MTERKNIGWIKFVPSLDLPKERVSIAYDTHDERGVRYAYGYFQFYNGTCGCFWKDGNEQPKVVKAEDIKYWMPIPSLDVQEEPVSEDLDKEIDNAHKLFYEEVGWDSAEGARAYVADWFAHYFANWQKQQMEAYRIEHCKSLTNEQAELEDNFVSSHVEKNNRIPTFIDAIEYGMNLQKEHLMATAVDAVVKVDAGGYPYIDRTIELYDYDKDIPLAKKGDKYKVILIKED